MTKRNSKAAVAIAVERLNALDAGEDAEAAHGSADEILLDVVPEDVARAYRRLVRRSPWWGTA